MTVPALSLRSGQQLPQIGLGFWKVANDRCPSLVREAVETGYRHLDCACDYGNEKEVGDGIRQVLDDGLCNRDDLWVTSKLWNTYHRPEHVRAACQRSLNDLQLEQLDLYLIHFPISLAYVDFAERYPPGWFFDPDAEQPQMKEDLVPLAETWDAVRQLRDEGLAANIGVCNFGVSLIRDLIAASNEPPAVLQIESHPHLTQQKLLRYCQQQGIAVTAFSPLGAQSYHELGMADADDSLIESKRIDKIGERHQRTPAQVLLRWGVQRGTAVIPKTSNSDRLRENIAIFDFELTEEEMGIINRLNENRRYNDPGDFCESAFNTFYPIYE